MLLAKIQKSKFISEMYSDEYLYFKSLHDFRSHIVDTTGRNDPKEGNLKNVQIQYLSVTAEEKEIILSKELSNFNAQLTEHLTEQKINCCSMYSLMLAKKTKTYNIDDRVIQMGDKALLIFDIINFFKILDNSLEENGFDFSRKLVTYYDPKSFNGEITIHHKDILYEYQKEYRILIAPTDNLPIKIPIPGLKKISKVIETPELRSL